VEVVVGFGVGASVVATDVGSVVGLAVGDIVGFGVGASVVAMDVGSVVGLVVGRPQSWPTSSQAVCRIHFALELTRAKTLGRPPCPQPVV